MRNLKIGLMMIGIIVKRIVIFILIILSTLILVGGSTKTEDVEKKYEYIEMGKKLYSQKDYYGAIEMWKEALIIDPWDEEVQALIQNTVEKIETITTNLKIGLELIEKGKYDEAYKILTEVKKNVSDSDTETMSALKEGFRRIEAGKRRLKFKQLVDQGDRALADMKIDEAESFYKKAKELEPNNPIIAEKLALLEKEKKMLNRIEQIQKMIAEGKVLYEQDELDKAKKIFYKVLAIDKENNEAKLYLSKIEFKEKEREKLLLEAKNYFEAGVKYYNDGLYNEAIEQFLNSIAMNYNVKKAEDFIEKSRNAILRIRKKENQQLLEKVLSLLRDGIKYYNLNQHRKALDVLTKAFELDPANSQVKEYLLRVSIALKRQEERYVPETSPFYKLVETLKRLGLEAYRNKRYAESIKYWEEILLIFPYNESAKIYLTRALSKVDPSFGSEILKNLYSRAEELYSRDRKKEAEEALKMILSVNPDYLDAKRMLERIKETEKKVKTIITETQKAKAKKLYEKGLRMYSEEKLEEAVKAWKEAVEINPDLIEARVYLARAETELRNFQRAIKQEKETEVALSKTHIMARKYYLNGINYYLEGLYEEAISDWEKALEIEPNNESIKMNIKRAKERLEYVAQRKG